MLLKSATEPVTVPVAVRFASERLPEKSALPWRERREEGVVVPMPTLPEVARKSEDVAVMVSVPEKYGNCPVVPVSCD